MIKRFENKYMQSIRRGYLCHITPDKKCYGFEYHHNSNGCEIFNEKFGGCSNRRYNMIKYRIYAD